MQNNWRDWFIEQHNQLPTKRTRTEYSNKTARYISCDNQSYLNFISNDYLGLSNNLDVIKSNINASERLGIGSTGAGTLSGFSEAHGELTRKLAQWLQQDACLLFSSGYHLNTSVYSTLVNHNTIVWFDKACHASHVDGILLSKAKFNTFNAQTIDNVLDHINTLKDNLHIIVTEGTFSMDGTCAYLHKLIKLKHNNSNNVLLIIDDAHGIGVLGNNGFGTLEQQDIPLSDFDIIIGTLGKGFGTFGGFMCGTKHIVDYVGQTARGLLFTTTTPPCIVNATISSLEIIRSNIGIGLRNKLKENIDHFKTGAKSYDLPIYNYDCNISPIQLLVFNDNDIIEHLFDELQLKKILVAKMMYPTVKKNAPRIRISITASHTTQDIHTLCETLHLSLAKYQ